MKFVASRPAHHPMSRIMEWDDAPSGKVVHLVDRLTDDLQRFLKPAIVAIAGEGIEQTLLIVDDDRSRAMLTDVHPSIQVVLTRDSRNVVRRWRASLGHFESALKSGPVRSIHLHGLVPAMLAPRVMRAAKVDVPAFHAPHATRSLQSFRHFGRVLWRVASNSSKARVGVVESPVDSVFFGGERHDPPRPLVLTASTTEKPSHVKQMAQLAVLLFDEDPTPAFGYLGNVGAASLKRLKAAKIEVLDLPNEIDRAIKLASASVFVATSQGPAYPSSLAEAMASGLACVAMDSQVHREMLRHGKTGLLCDTFEDLLEQVARLLHSPELRQRLGDAARAEAQQRFTNDAFRHSLLAAYELSAPAPLAADLPMPDTNMLGAHLQRFSS